MNTDMNSCFAECVYASYAVSLANPSGTALCTSCTVDVLDVFVFTPDDARAAVYATNLPNPQDKVLHFEVE